VAEGARDGGAQTGEAAADGIDEEEGLGHAVA